MKSISKLVGETSLISFLDVGAALSEHPPYKDLVEARRAKVIGFEPNQKECEKLNQTFGSPHKFFPYFIGDGSTATFHETNWHETGSLFEPNTDVLSKFQGLFEFMTPVATHSVETRRLDDIEEVSDIDFFKIDIQGGELAVFENASRVLSSVLIIQTEVEFVEMYRGQPMFADIDVYLRKAGFQFHTFNGFGCRAFKPMLINNNPYAGLRQFLWSDAIYVRNWMNLHDIETDKLKKFAILSYDVLKSADLTQLILTEVDKRENGNLTRNFLNEIASYVENRRKSQS